MPGHGGGEALNLKGFGAYEPDSRVMAPVRQNMTEVAWSARSTLQIKEMT
jgi:hypothetical protein